MTYTELHKRIWNLNEYRRSGKKDTVDEVNRRIDALEDDERTAYRIIFLMLGHNGFDEWWDHETGSGMHPEWNEEIFEGVKAIIRNQGLTP